MTLFALAIAYYSMHYHRLRASHAAVKAIRSAGASVYLMDARGYVKDNIEIERPTLFSVVSGNFDSHVISMELTNPQLSEESIANLIPHLERLIPSQALNGSGQSFISIDACGNPNITEDLLAKFQTRLPQCRFVEYTPVPRATQDAIQLGMSKQQVIETVGALMFDQRTDWPDERKATVRMLGSQMNLKYTGLKGTETWTYFTDNVGIGLLGIDFDSNQNVIEIWSSRGLPADRRSQLTPPGMPMLQGL